MFIITNDKHVKPFIFRGLFSITHRGCSLLHLATLSVTFIMLSNVMQLNKYPHKILRLFIQLAHTHFNLFFIKNICPTRLYPQSLRSMENLWKAHSWHAPQKPTTLHNSAYILLMQQCLLVRRGLIDPGSAKSWNKNFTVIRMTRK